MYNVYFLTININLFLLLCIKKMPTKNSPQDALLGPARGIPVGTHTRKYVFQQAPYGPGARGTS
jgi:hypothetical protein